MCHAVAEVQGASDGKRGDIASAAAAEREIATGSERAFLFEHPLRRGGVEKGRAFIHPFHNTKPLLFQPCAILQQLRPANIKAGHANH